MKKLFDEKIYESKLFQVAQDWKIPITGFYILSPKRKLSSVADFTEEEQREFGTVLHHVRKGMDEILGIKEVYLFQNEDTQHGFHVWIFPRHPWMERFGRKIQSVKPIMEYAEAEMATEKEMSNVKEAAQKMKEYLNA